MSVIFFFASCKRFRQLSSSLFLISAEYKITTTTTYSSCKFWSSIWWGNTQCPSHCLQTKTCSHIVSSKSVLNTFYASMNSSFDSFQLDTADVFLRAVSAFLHSVQADWTPQMTAQKPKRCMAYTSYVHSHASGCRKFSRSCCLALACNRLWRKESLSWC